MENVLSLEKELCFTIYETASEMNNLYSNALQPFELTYPQYLVLLSLWENDGILVNDLEERLNLDTGTLTPMINRMVAHDWIRKVRTHTDERKVYIYLQPKALQEQAKITQAITEEVLSCQIEFREYKQLMEQLQQLHQKLKNRTSNG